MFEEGEEWSGGLKHKVIIVPCCSPVNEVRDDGWTFCWTEQLQVCSLFAHHTFPSCAAAGSAFAATVSPFVEANFPVNP